MHVIEAKNIRDALPQAVDFLITHGVCESSRNGPVYAAPEPVTIQYSNPKQHVLLSPVRDANPFFHLMEAMWMLAGRQDGAFLDHYVKDFSKRFGNNGIIMDSYGHRWRYALRFDQLNVIVSQLRKDPTTRQCVLQMWGAGETRELFAVSAKPCNLSVAFRITKNKLDMTVFNRSNDVIWGACGANAVHFPMLQEYIAGRVGVEIGTYWQVSSNLHLYQAHIDMLKQRILTDSINVVVEHLVDYSLYGSTQPLIGEDIDDAFDDNLNATMACIDTIHDNQEFYDGHISNEFLRDTVIRMALAHQQYKMRDIVGALTTLDTVKAEDWKQAGIGWLERHHGRG